jgi:hypothetical protein
MTSKSVSQSSPGCLGIAGNFISLLLINLFVVAMAAGAG